MKRNCSFRDGSDEQGFRSKISLQMASRETFSTTDADKRLLQRLGTEHGYQLRTTRTVGDLDWTNGPYREEVELAISNLKHTGMMGWAQG